MDILDNKIGNYIHYNHLDYLRYGLNTAGGSTSSQRNISQIFNQQKQRILKEIKALIKNRDKISTKEKIEQNLNFFKNVKNNTSTIQGLKWSKSDIETIEKKIQTLLENKFKASEYDWEKITAFSEGGSAFSQGFKLNQILKDENGKDHSWQLKKNLQEKGKNNIHSIELRLEILKNNLNSIKAEDLTNIESLKNKLFNLETEWNNIKNEFLQGKTNKQYYIYNQNSSTFIHELNKLWNEFSGSVSSYITGQLGEYYAAICQDLIKNRGNMAVNDVLTYLEELFSSQNMEEQLRLTGKQTSSVALSRKHFAVTGRKDKNQFQHFTDDLFTDFIGGKVHTHATQDKVDLEIVLDEIESPILASIKNYNLNSRFGIHLHSGRSILSLTQEYCNFMNHYLNITAWSQNDTANKKGSQQALNHVTKQWIQPANEALKLTMGLKALAGGIYKLNKAGFGPNKMAEVFIINGNDGMYKVYFVDDIIDVLKDNLSLLNIKNFNLQKTWVNKWVVGDKKDNYKSAHSRIRNLLQQLHEFELDISINSNILTLLK